MQVNIMWDNPMKTIDSIINNESFTEETRVVHPMKSGESLEYLKWMAAGVLLGIFVVLTMVISLVTYMDIKQAEKHTAQTEMETFEVDKFELELLRTDRR